MTISINTNSPAPLASQDLAGNQAAPGGQPGAALSATADPVVEGPAGQLDQVTAHAGLVALANAAAPTSVSGLVNPDLDGEGARLQALQLQQQLGGQSVSIANQAPQALLALLR